MMKWNDKCRYYAYGQITRAGVVNMQRIVKASMETLLGSSPNEFA